MTRPARVFWAAAAAVMIAALFVGGRQEMAAGLFPPPWDKLAHFAYYFVLTGVLWLAGGARGALWAALVAIGVGVADELHQATLPHRDASVWDLLADAIGAAAAGVLLPSLDRAATLDKSTSSA